MPRNTLNLPYNPVHSVEWLDKFFKKNYYKKPYDRFMWWRSYTPKFKPLGKRSTVRERILNGDFDLSPFKFEAELVEHRINERFKKIGHDPVQFNEQNSLDKARRKRLLEDYEKDEAKKLEEFRKCICELTCMSIDEYEEYIINVPRKWELIDIWYDIEKKYNVKRKPVSSFRN
tara:strand:- start:2817 stop:3338 length:522 start_codon:yes stop_codon:yes gene_type:complete